MHHSYVLWVVRERTLIPAAQPSMYLDREKSACPSSLSSLWLFTYYLDCSNPIRAAYITSLESQISSLRDELATVYKTQGQNAQRLLAMNETLREKEELSRVDSENLRKARDEIAALRKKVEQHNELMAEKDRTAQVRLICPMVPIWVLTPSHRFCMTRSTHSS